MFNNNGTTRLLTAIVLIAAALLSACAGTTNAPMQPAPAYNAENAMAANTSNTFNAAANILAMSTPVKTDCVVVQRGNKVMFDPETIQIGDVVLQLAPTGKIVTTSDPYQYGVITCVQGKPKVATGDADLNCNSQTIVWDDNGGWRCTTYSGQLESQDGVPFWPEGEPSH